MMVLLGDEVTISRDISGSTTWVTGRISGIVQKDNGDLKYFYIKGVDNSFWMSDGWVFADEGEEDTDA
jgi:hypothetical protein